jgi:hypothetical protein
MTTLQQYFETEKTLSQARRNTAQTEFAAAQKAAADARAAQEARTAAVAAKLSAIAALRREIAAAATPADMDALLVKLRTALVELRNLRSGLLDAQRIQDAAEADKDQAGAVSAAATAALAAATDAADREAGRRKRLDDWIAKLAKEPLASVATQAQAVLNGQLFKDAKATGEEIPKDPRERALARLQAEIDAQRAELAEAATADTDLAKLAESSAGRAWDTFLSAEAELGAWVSGAVSRLEQAKGLLERAKNAHLTADEKKYLTDHPAPAAALKAEEALDKALAARDKAKVELEQKKAALLTIDIDADVEKDLAFQPFKDALEKAETDLKKARTDFAAQRVALEEWEAATPDAVWESLGAFDRAGRILNELKAGPGNRVTDLNNAEAALVTALEKETKSGRTLDYLRARAAALRGRLDRTENLREPRIARAARGDA